MNKKQSSPAPLAESPSVEELVDGTVARKGKRNWRGPRNSTVGSRPKPSKRSIPRPDLRVESNGGVTIFGDGNNGKYLDGEIPERDRHYATASTYTDVIVYHVGNVYNRARNGSGRRASRNPNRGSRGDGRT